MTATPAQVSPTHRKLVVDFHRSRDMILAQNKTHLLRCFQEAFQRMKVEHECNQLRAQNRSHLMMIAQLQVAVAQLTLENQQLKLQTTTAPFGSVFGLHAGSQHPEASIPREVALRADGSNGISGLKRENETNEQFLCRKWVNADTVEEAERLRREGLPGLSRMHEIESVKATRDLQGHKSVAERQELTRTKKVVKTVDKLAEALQLPTKECAKILDKMMEHEFQWVPSLKQATLDAITEKVKSGLARLGYRDVDFRMRPES